MTEQTCTLTPISAALAAEIRAARYGLFEPGLDRALQGVDDLPALALEIITRRRGRTLALDDTALIWGEGRDERRAAIRVTFGHKDGSIDQVLTALCWSERAGHLFQALQTARAAIKRAA